MSGSAANSAAAPKRLAQRIIPLYVIIGQVDRSHNGTRACWNRILTFSGLDWPTGRYWSPGLQVRNSRLYGAVSLRVTRCQSKSLTTVSQPRRSSGFSSNRNVIRVLEPGSSTVPGAWIGKANAGSRTPRQSAGVNRSKLNDRTTSTPGSRT